MVSTRRNLDCINFACSTPIKKCKKGRQLKEEFNAIAKNLVTTVPDASSSVVTTDGTPSADAITAVSATTPQPQPSTIGMQTKKPTVEKTWKPRKNLKQYKLLN